MNFSIMKKPFTKEEQEIMNLLIEANNKFNNLKITHPSEKDEWLHSFHNLQSLLMCRVTRRDYPNDFFSL